MKNKTLLVVPALLALASPARAQLRLEGGALFSPVTRRVSYQGAVREQSGTWIGAQGAVHLGRIEIGASGLFGTVGGDSDKTTNPDLTMRVSDLWVQMRASPLFGVGLNFEARHQQSTVGATAWRLIGPTVHLTPGLGLAGLSGSAEVTYFVSSSVIGSGEKISPAIRATLGAIWSPPPGRVELRVSYRFERFDFAAVGTSPARLEQFAGILAGIGLRLGGGR